MLLQPCGWLSVLAELNLHLAKSSQNPSSTDTRLQPWGILNAHSFCSNLIPKNHHMPAPQFLALLCHSFATFGIIHPFSYPCCHCSDLRLESIRRCCIYKIISICSLRQRLGPDEHHHLQDPVSENEPYQHLSENTRHLLINPLLCARQLNVHVAVNAHETSLVFGLAPFESDYDFFVNPITCHKSAQVRIIVRIDIC